MASGGHNIKSTSEHKAKGNYRPSRHKDRAEHIAKPLDTMPKPPADMDKRHRDKWVEVVGKVFELGALTDKDLDFIDKYVEQWFVAQDSFAEIKSFGITLENEKGVRYPNPAIKIYNEATEKILKIGDKFGFSPKARMGLKVEPKKEVDPFAAFTAN